jgi:hypothetical protein
LFAQMSVVGQRAVVHQFRGLDDVGRQAYGLQLLRHVSWHSSDLAARSPAPAAQIRICSRDRS